MNSEFNRDYQEHILARMFTKSFLDEVGGFLVSDIFDQDLAPAAEFILKTYHKHGKAPSPTQIRQHIDNVKLPHPNKDVPVNLDVESVFEFVRMRRIRRTLLDANAMLVNGQTNEAIMELTKAGRGFSRHDDSGFDYFDPNAGVESNRGEGLNCDIETLDIAMGGVCRGEMALCMAPSNGGKSAWLIHVASLAVAQGLNVFFASLEMTQHSMKERFEQRFATMKLKKKTRGNLHIYCQPPDSITAPHLNAQIEYAEARPDVVIIDSADLVAPVRRWSSQWEEEKETYRNIKALALEHDLILWCSSQARRSGFGKDAIGQAEVQGSISKVQIVDHVISINQDLDEMIANEQGVSDIMIHLSKCRFGPKGARVPIAAEFATCNFYEQEPYADDDDE